MTGCYNSDMEKQETNQEAAKEAVKKRCRVCGSYENMKYGFRHGRQRYHTTVLKWVYRWAKENYQKPKPKGEVLIELDEMHHFIRSKKTSVGCGRHMTARMEGYLTGKWGVEIPQLLQGCITD